MVNDNVYLQIQSREVLEFSKQIKEKMKEIDTFGKSFLFLPQLYCCSIFLFVTNLLYSFIYAQRFCAQFPLECHSSNYLSL